MQQTHKPQWRTHHPIPPTVLTGWTLVTLGIIGGVLLCITISPTALVIVGGIVTLGVLALTILIDIGTTYNVLGTTQICPMCGREAPQGYSRCLCGYPER